MFLQGAPKVVYGRRNECGQWRPSSTTRVGPAGKGPSLRLPNLGTPCQCSAMNHSPPEPASPASSSTDSLDDDVPIPHEYSGSATHEKAERSSFITNTFAFAKSVAKRRLPGGTTKTTSNRDPKARRREEGGQRRGGPSDRRDPTKGKDDLLDVALFEHLKKKIGDPINDDMIKRVA